MKLLLVFLLLSCSHLKKAPESWSEAKFWSDQKARRSLFKKYSGRIRLYLEDKHENVSGRGQVVVVLPEALRWEIRGPLGRLQHLLQYKKGLVTAYYPGTKTVYEDSKGGSRYFSALFDIPITVPRLERLLMGVIPPGKKSLNWIWDGSLGWYRAKFVQEDQRWEIWVDPKTTTLRQLEWSDGRSEAKMQYEFFKKCCSDRPSIQLARQISIKSAKAFLEWEWKSVEIRKKVSDKAFILKLPKDVRKILLKDS